MVGEDWPGVVEIVLRGGGGSFVFAVGEVLRFSCRMDGAERVPAGVGFGCVTCIMIRICIRIRI